MLKGVLFGIFLGGSATSFGYEYEMARRKRMRLMRCMIVENDGNMNAKWAHDEDDSK